MRIMHWANPAAAHAMVSDPMCKLWTHNWPAPNGSRNWLRALAFQAGFVAILGLATELDAYAARLQAVLYPRRRQAASAC